MRNGFQPQRIEVFRLLPLRVNGQDLVDGHRQHLAIVAGLILHFQDANGATGDDHARNQGYRGHDQHIDRIAVAGNGLGHVPVVGRVMHGGAHETINKDGAGSLVHFVLDRIGVHGDFNDHIERLGNVFASGDVVEGHGSFSALIQVGGD